MALKQLFLISFLGLITVRICGATPPYPCTKIETYTMVSYDRQQFSPFSHWMSHRYHSVPHKYNRIGFRTRHAMCCEPGYKLNESQSNCSPACYGCKRNEYCSSPGVCSCNPGFRKEFLTNWYYRCVEIPTTTPEPEHTTVMTSQPPLEATTTTATTPTTRTSPTTTTPTMPTMSTTFSDDQEDIETTSTRSESCSGGSCVCQQGFEMSVRNGAPQCEPKCEPECQNADCVEPNHCACWSGYLRTNESSCHQPCSRRTCAFGKCDEFGACVCLPGFRKNGIDCVSEDDAILSDPKSCKCWLRVNATNEPCANLCETLDDKSHCIDFTRCKSSGVMLACESHLFTCTTATSLPPDDFLVDDGKDVETGSKMTLVIVGFIASILAVGVLVYVWLKCRRRQGPMSTYDHMEEEGQGPASL